MIIRNVDYIDIVKALDTVNSVFGDNIVFKRFDRLSPSKGGGYTFAVTLTVKDSRGLGSRHNLGGRRISAACWHSIGLFHDSLPPDTPIKTGGPWGAGVSGHKNPGDSWEDWKVQYMGGRGWFSATCDCASQSLDLPLPGHVLINDYGDPVIIVDSHSEHDRTYNIIKGYGELDSELVAQEVAGVSFTPDQIEVYFSDTDTPCYNCYERAISISPDSYGWQLTGHFFECDGYVCSDCIAKDEDLQLEILQDSINANKLVNLDKVDPSGHGFIILCDPDNPGYSNPDGQLEYENGLHPGQSDTPEQQIELLNEAGIDCCFSGWVGQFDIKWIIWIKWSDGAVRQFEGLNLTVPAVNDVALWIMNKGYTGLGYDPGAEMAKVLRGEESKHYQITSRTLTSEEFISGNWARGDHNG